jgi:hypothetical protein
MTHNIASNNKAYKTQWHDELQNKYLIGAWYLLGSVGSLTLPRTRAFLHRQEKKSISITKRRDPSSR